MIRSLRNFERRVLPHGVGDLVRQLLLFAAAYYCYQIVRGMVDGKGAVAAWNATKIINLEHSLHVFVEPSVQSWAASTGWISDFAAWMYINSHFVVTVGSLAFIYLFRNEAFYFVRNMFMVAMGIALIGYASFPTAPPRLMPEWGFTDTVAAFTGVRVENEPVSALLNLYAAVPSMHCCFALMIGWPMARLVKPKPLKVLWFLYPFLVMFVVVATGNHYVFDAALGAATAGISALVAWQLFGRLRPAAWSFGQVERAEATA
ncbi:phosphatase PAP2 family protein [Conexibacter sp. JD483]|uniref:phosphatase PAP2 family protein n=1 Tax=unclassified Conexibacter TaxID=2627773 RepID=UPI00271DFAF2|nr:MULTISPECIES: phosphatase PAP2 family protein [unclassified Conexibacter]MDO8187029.1 phosphatase PAP2 family protein [Conexibacter sp. CPCC 205706]MDO8200653.1 phosphatase PAP2 family protein [Conexibacter sp. CPCC 205762]MDR9371611.1 phosphatase PAP2 family protein [Conexibacter sp. JD483]